MDEWKTNGLLDGTSTGQADHEICCRQDVRNGLQPKYPESVSLALRSSHAFSLVPCDRKDSSSKYKTVIIPVLLKGSIGTAEKPKSPPTYSTDQPRGTEK